MAGDIAKFIQLVTEQIGKPYNYGGDTPAESFDCSGLIHWAAGAAGFEGVPRVSSQQWTALDRVENPLIGDMVFFNNGDGGPQPGHVGMCAVPGCSTMVDAPRTGKLIGLHSVEGYGQIVGYGRLPGAGTADELGNRALIDRGFGNVGLADESVTPGSVVSDVLDPVIGAIAALPGALIKVLTGGKSLGEIALRGVEITGGALVLAAGGVMYLRVLARGSSPGAQGIRGARSAGRTVTRQGRRLGRSVAPGRSPAPRRTGTARNELEAGMRRSGAATRGAAEGVYRDG